MLPMCRRWPHCYNALALASETTTLRRSLGLLETTLGGIGIILGAGIYVLVGEVAGEAGNALWVSFLIATGAAVAVGFGSYLKTFIGVGTTPIAVGALVVATLIAFYGIRESVWTSMVLTLVEAGGLVFVIAIGVPHLGDVDLLESKAGATGIFGGASLVMFAFIGFEQIATLSEETRDASRVIPRALLLAIAVTATLYLLVALAAVSVLGWEALSDSDAPLASVASEVLGGRAEDFIAVVALFSTANTVLLLLVAASRLIYSMAARGSLPRFLAWIHPRVHP